MDVTITNAGGRIEIVDLRNDLTNNYNVLKDGLRLFNLGDIVRITFINRRNIEINYNEVELINGATSILPVSGVDFLNELNVLLGDFGAGGGATALEDLTDVQITSVANGEVLIYDSTLSKWVNTSAPGGGDMFKAVYDTDNDGVVDKAETVQIVVRNSTGVTLTKGQIVYLSGATGNRPNAVLAQANSEATSSKTIGWVFENINNNSDGFVAVSGSDHNLDTSAFAAGDALWLSPTVAGGMTATMPTQPDHAVFIGFCARSHPTQGRIVFKIQNGYELEELHNVLINSVADNDGLFYESSSGLWKNKTIESVLPSTVLIGSIPYVEREYIGFSGANAIVKVPGSNRIFVANTTTGRVICYDTQTSEALSTTIVSNVSGLVYVAATGEVWAFYAANFIFRFTASTGVSLGSTAVTGLTAGCRGVYDDSTVTGNVYAYNGPTMNVINHSTYARTGVTINLSASNTHELTLVTSGPQAGLLIGTVNIGIFGFNKTTNTLAFSPISGAANGARSIKYIPSINRIVAVSGSRILFYETTTSTTLTLMNSLQNTLNANYIDFDETENFLFVISGFASGGLLKLSIFDLTTLLSIKTMLLTLITDNAVGYIAPDKSNKTLYITGTTTNGIINKVIYA